MDCFIVSKILTNWSFYLRLVLNWLNNSIDSIFCQRSLWMPHRKTIAMNLLSTQFMNGSSRERQSPWLKSFGTTRKPRIPFIAVFKAAIPSQNLPLLFRAGETLGGNGGRRAGGQRGRWTTNPQIFVQGWCSCITHLPDELNPFFPWTQHSLHTRGFIMQLLTQLWHICDHDPTFFSAKAPLQTMGSNPFYRDIIIPVWVSMSVGHW